MGFFDNAYSGEKYESFVFGKNGEMIVGVVKRVGKPFQGKGMDGQPEVTKNGNPVYTLPVTVETAEDTRVLYVKGAAMTAAIGNALLNVGKNDLEPGMQIGVRRGDKQKTAQGYMAWTYEAQIKLSA